jgi:spore coat polysaccharide biosynthesis protein SpsF
MGIAPKSVFEIGANVGMNLDAIRLLCPEVNTHGIDVNMGAADVATKKGHHVASTPIEEFSATERHELVLSKGVLIHLNPDSLKSAYHLLGNLSSRYVLIAEYFSPKPVALEYRGHENRLFKRDFADEFLKASPNFELRDFGFLSSMGPFPQDNINWYLLERRREEG